MRPINTKAKDKARDNVERMVAATKRLEALLADPGPGIIVRRLPPAQNDDTPPLTAAPPIAQPAEEAPQQAPATPILTPPAAKPLSEASASELEQSKPEPVASEAPAIVARPAATADVSPPPPKSRTPEPVTAPMPPLSVATVAPQSQEAPKRAVEPRPRPAQSQEAPPAAASPAASRRPSGSTEQREAAKPAVSHVVPRAETVKAAAAPAPAETKPIAPPAAPQRATAAAAGSHTETAKPATARGEAKPAPATAKTPSEPAHNLPAPPAPKPLNAKPAPAPGTAAAARANHGFVGGLIDWLMPGTSDLKSAVALSGRAFAAAGVFSFVINVLMLAGPLFMLQVYDRVMSSGSLPTLVSLFAITVGLYGIIGMLELSRSRVIVRIGVEVDQRLGERIFRASLKRSLASPGAAIPALRELDNIRQFVSGQGPMTFFDAPWTPVYLLVIFLVHWVLGVAALIGAVLLIAIAWASESHSREPLKQSGKASMRSLELADTGQRNAELITAMGMIGSYLVRWQRANGEALAWQTFGCRPAWRNGRAVEDDAPHPAVGHARHRCGFGGQG